MQWYWAISCSNTVKRPFVASKADLYGFENSDFRIGRYIEKWNSRAWIQCTKPEWNGEPDDVLQTHLAIPIFSPRLQVVIKKAEISGIQFLPLRVIRMDQSEIKGFAIANILNVPAAMDMETSWYDKFEEDYFAIEDRGKVSGVYRMSLRQSLLCGYDIIRVKQFHQSEYVSERFKLEFESAACTGYSFKEVQLT